MVGLWGFTYREPHNGDGFWGEKTSTLNFCEEDYVMSHYVAEVCNTFTNMLFIWLGIKGIRGCLKYSHPTIFVIAYIGYMIVGMGSTAFHASLKYSWQLVDELSMIYTTCLMVFATFSYARSTRTSALLGAGLMGLAWFITAYYYKTKNPDFHQISYAILTALVVFSNMAIIQKHVRPALNKRQKTRPPDSTVPPADAIVKEMWLMLVVGLSIFLGGYALWIADIELCPEIRGWRRHIQLPWGVLLEGHGWWHLMTGIGAYYYITWRVWIHHCLEGNEDKFRLKWPSIFSIPEVVSVEDAKKRL